MSERICSCGNIVPFKTVIDGVERELKNRKRCLTCSPFQARNNRSIASFSLRPRTDANEKYRRWQEKARSQRKARLIQLLGGKCSVCGYSRCIAALEFHHRDPSTKLFSLGKDRLLKRWEVVLEEAQKCDLLCANCHRELEERLRADEESPLNPVP
jgi:hypothetical protein